MSSRIFYIFITSACLLSFVKPDIVISCKSSRPTDGPRSTVCTTSLFNSKSQTIGESLFTQDFSITEKRVRPADAIVVLAKEPTDKTGEKTYENHFDYFGTYGAAEDLSRLNEGSEQTVQVILPESFSLSLLRQKQKGVHYELPGPPAY